MKWGFGDHQSIGEGLFVSADSLNLCATYVREIQQGSSLFSLPMFAFSPSPLCFFLCTPLRNSIASSRSGLQQDLSPFTRACGRLCFASISRLSRVGGGQRHRYFRNGGRTKGVSPVSRVILAVSCHRCPLGRQSQCCLTQMANCPNYHTKVII